MYHEMKVYGFALDPLSKSPVVILKDLDDTLTVPIWITTSDAVAMATELVTRSMTGDAGEVQLLALLLERFEMVIDRLTLDSSSGGGFHVAVVCSSPDGEEEFEVRLLDVLLLAIRQEMTILVAEDVVARSSEVQLEDGEISDLDAGRFAEFLEKLDPADMGKYPM